MSTPKWIRPVFGIAAVYDLVLGLAFLVFPAAVFSGTQTPPVNHLGYVQFPAMLLVVFGLSFFAVALDPLKYRPLMLMGVGLKVSYCAVSFYYWFAAGVPSLFKPFAVADAVMLVLFVTAWYATKPLTTGAVHGRGSKADLRPA